ncbi:zinc finger protein with KRAB and SCAN domains 3 [Drosophila serrata]|uniref:zinc finger protein with KRAB and SCAN domains 3 n=1 Tax=Drosophila serrata TaxID=7274 RepID=UPI000A1CFA9A|nr:zinc finger protein with KRAB and SCAN domains 3 [Drosophila serrata]KAH8388716.1 hypothetical protein KR200_005543 [Drosophila serrata]
MPNNLESRVVDLGLACLVCLTEELGSTSVYSHDLEPPNMVILEKIRSCTGLKLECRAYTHMEGWPDKICQQCYIELTVAYRFREKCAAVEKLFQQQQQMQLKMELEQHQVRLPATLKIKRLEMEPLGASGDTLCSTLATAAESSYYQEIVEEVDEEESQEETVPAVPTADAVTLLPDEAMVLSLADLDETDPIKMRPESLASSDEEAEDKLLALAPWDNDQTPEHLYEIETPIMEEELPTQSLPPPPPPPPAQATSKLRKRTYRRVSPIVKQDSGRDASSDLDKDFQPVVVTSSKRRQSERSPKICDVCGNTYKYQHALNAHMRRHNNERPYPCEVCQKAFISNVELRRHMRVHTGQKPYGCKFCERRFSDFGSSKKHERIHTGERPYVCEVCHKGFAYAHVLSVHRRTHTGKKQFQCTKCDKGFTKKSYLSAHMDQHRGSGSAELTEEDGEAMGSGFSAGAGSLRLSGRKPDTFSLDSVVLGEQNKVLEECIVTNDFMFNEEDDDDGRAVVDENEEAEATEDTNHHESYPPQPDFDDVDGYQSVRSVKELVGDLLDSEEFDDESKYLID